MSNLLTELEKIEKMAKAEWLKAQTEADYLPSSQEEHARYNAHYWMGYQSGAWAMKKALRDYLEGN